MGINNISYQPLALILLTSPKEVAGLVTRMAGDSPGLGLLLVVVMMGSLVRGNSEVVGRTVVLEIQELTQPYNCSAFFDHLEVSSFCPISFVTRKSVVVKAEFGYLTMGCSCALGRVRGAGQTSVGRGGRWIIICVFSVQ